jgi:tRNA(fMet)-specific endonuclease VapC
VTLWLLDTNMISDLVRNPFGPVAQRIETADNEEICTSIVVACELRYGVTKRGSIKLTERIEATLAYIDVRPLIEDADRHYAALRCQLEHRGKPIGSNDMLIAAHALALGATLVTANTREFIRIENLSLENWLS